MKAIYILIVLFFPLILNAKDSKEYLRKGNEQYEKKKFNEAEINYRKSRELDNKSHKAVFNLGDALYKQEQYDKAAQEFANIANRKIDEETTSKAYHNLGNSYLKTKNFKESIDAFKNSLRLNPKDIDTKYNLEYAKKMLMQQQQQQQQKQNKNDKNQDKDKQDQQKQDQNKGDQNKDKQDQKQNKDGDKQEQQQQQQQQGQKEQKISKKDAERILQALNQEEKNLQKKLKKVVRGTRGTAEKQW